MCVHVCILPPACCLTCSSSNLRCACSAAARARAAASSWRRFFSACSSRTTAVLSCNNAMHARCQTSNSGSILQVEKPNGQLRAQHDQTSQVEQLSTEQAAEPACTRAVLQATCHLTGINSPVCNHLPANSALLPTISCNCCRWAVHAQSWILSAPWMDALFAGLVKNPSPCHAVQKKEHSSMRPHSPCEQKQSHLDAFLQLLFKQSSTRPHLLCDPTHPVVFLQLLFECCRLPLPGLQLHPHPRALSHHTNQPQ